jgi:NtrC-family two-component system response regulator AlgB
MSKRSEVRVLVIDDEESIRKMLRVCLEGAGYRVTLAPTGEAGVAAAKRSPPDVALVDLRLGGMDGIAVARALAQEVEAAAVVIMTAYATIDNAVDAMRAGAADYLPKPFTPAQVLHVVQKVVSAQGLRAELAELKSATSRGVRPRFESRSPAVRDALSVASRVAAADVTVLLLGETGTGKGVLARHIHALSPREGRPFVTVNCAVISPSLIENELFGHARGAFTGADSAQVGHVEVAGSGTLFLDEVGDLALEAQPKLLRALENGEVTPIGSTQPLTVSVRVVSATHVPLDAALDDGRFRRDLYARLAGVIVKTPALAGRREDVPLLFDSFLGEGDTRLMSADFVESLLVHGWPFNVRELKKLAERLAVLHAGAPCWERGMLDEDMLPGPEPEAEEPGARASHGTVPPAPRDSPPAREELIALLERCDGNVSRVAELVSRNRKQVYRWMKAHAVEPGTGRKE